MTESPQTPLSELERFGAANDGATAERLRRMLNITRDTGECIPRAGSRSLRARRDEGESSMSTSDRSCVIRAANTEIGATIFQHGTLDVKLTLPARPNVQTPHAQDELYIAVRGRGVLFHDGARDPFEPGDFLFVAAGVEHHFEDFGDDLPVWRVFYGPDGGEITG